MLLTDTTSLVIKKCYFYYGNLKTSLNCFVRSAVLEDSCAEYLYNDSTET